MLKETNYAENAMTVGSLTVLHDIKNSGISTIKQNVEALQTTTQNMAVTLQSQKDYWSEITKDNAISPEEKKVLEKECQTIVTTHTFIMAAAREKEYTHHQTIEEYDAAYTALHSAIYDDLDLFSHMNQITTIEDRLQFNALFTTYYDKEFKAQSLLAQGDGGGYQDFEFASGSETEYPTDESAWHDSPPVIESGHFLWMRTRWVNASGIEGTWTYSRLQGERGATGRDMKTQYSANKESWHDTFVFGDYYMHISTDGGTTWGEAIKIVGEDGGIRDYLGKQEDGTNIKNPSEGNFFLAADNFTNREIFVTVSGALLVSGKRLAVTRNYEKGFVYIAHNGIWTKISDKNDWHYITALNDLVSIGEAISPALQEGIKNVSATATPKYLGSYTSETLIDKTKVNAGDWYLYVGQTDTQSGYVKGTCRKYVNGKFETISATDSNNYSQYMAALKDILAGSQTEELGVFGTLFVNALIASSAFIEHLSTMYLTLKSGGYIQSETYNGTAAGGGFRLSSNGTLDCYNGFFRGAIDSGPLYSNNSNTSAKTFNFASTDWADEDGIYGSLNKNGIYNGTHTITGNVGGNSVVKVTIATSTTTSETYPTDKYYYVFDYQETKYSEYHMRYIFNNHFKKYNEKLATIIYSYIYTFTKSDGSTVSYTRQKRINTYGGTSNGKYVSEYTTGWDGSKDPSKDKPADKLGSSNTTHDSMGVAWTNVVFSAGSKTLKFRNLPSSATGESGTVYTTGDGYLRIVN